ncbi:MAG: Prepilin-type N-cleavage/methylation domain protein [candidate division CPR2 bacterium GW2011_GWC1_39_9]|uniref:Prepilin-type N-cleavage/methylation domain protein n=1 Tax=candidate division CPR2 bacterium GW2011_GWC2_39_10 TaxID=1618345 RepID=A0A0G0PV87_UNCC2|nr:MAG: Prepilin-type N-cleavage/methylation domain protein [candidate division CPR2 bacterium GW2011_GWC2_39_10]KKR33494.1 MAG: Prepilin-type N-cleavage/methylation domain protein [candidate division CPR2 bacterium GW2011_GWC1_39_9]
MKKLKESKGFTLIELLVVIAIIGILATFIMVSVQNARKKAKDKQIMNALHQISTQEADLYDTNNAYADNADSADLLRLATEITDSTKGGSATAIDAVIIEDDVSYSAHAQLISDVTKYFCVDSTGAAETVTADVADTTCAP